MATYYGNTSPAYSNITITGAGTGAVLATTSYSTGATWTTTGANSPYVVVGATSKSALQVSGDAHIDGNLRVKGVDVGEVLAKIQDRLAILIPDPVLLEKYSALKQAYEHYKVLEALCVDETNPNE